MSNKFQLNADMIAILKALQLGTLTTHHAEDETLELLKLLNDNKFITLTKISKEQPNYYEIELCENRLAEIREKAKELNIEF